MRSVLHPWLLLLSALGWSASTTSSWCWCWRWCSQHRLLVYKLRRSSLPSSAEAHLSSVAHFAACLASRTSVRTLRPLVAPLATAKTCTATKHTWSRVLSSACGTRCKLRPLWSSELPTTPLASASTSVLWASSRLSDLGPLSFLSLYGTSEV